VENLSVALVPPSFDNQIRSTISAGPVIIAGHAKLDGYLGPYLFILSGCLLLIDYLVDYPRFLPINRIMKMQLKLVRGGYVGWRINRKGSAW
jgi:hypothetical protein